MLEGTQWLFSWDRKIPMAPAKKKVGIAILKRLIPEAFTAMISLSLESLENAASKPIKNARGIEEGRMEMTRSPAIFAKIVPITPLDINTSPSLRI